MKVKKERVSVTFSEPYMAFMSGLVKNGLYFNRGAVIMEALRLLALEHGISLVPEEKKREVET